MLAVLPIFGALGSFAYGRGATQHARLFPEDYWPVVNAIVFCLGFAVFCLLPGLILLSFHLRRDNSARWTFALASIKALGVLTAVFYINFVAR